MSTEKEGQKTPKDAAGSYSPRFVAGWTILIMAGLAFEFIGRLFGYADNPWALHSSSLPILAGIAAVLVLLAGFFVLRKARAARNAVAQRKGILLFVLGGVMLVGFFLFRQAIPYVFG